jgi:hypothetical protein
LRRRKRIAEKGHESEQSAFDPVFSTRGISLAGIEVRIERHVALLSPAGLFGWVDDLVAAAA